DFRQQPMVQFVLLGQLLGKREIAEKQPRSARRFSRRNRRECAIDCLRNGSDQMYLLTGTRNQHIQPASPTGAAQWTEATIKFPFAIRPIGGADDDVIALITLHAFEILEKQS